MNCEIIVRGLKLRAFHGVMDQERLVGNDFEVDVRVVYPFEKALVSDDVNDTLSYADIVEIIKQCMRQPSKLIEHVAGRIRESLIGTYPAIKGGMVAIRKLTPPVQGEMKYAGIKIEW
ncbi:MAG: dihydroneopterin aldolase [Muribaculaceae bacterium]|nr:dihydroneopterin aldolase [Muribaculaceae bacterium]